MHKDRFEAIYREIGMTLNDVARLFQINPRTAARWQSGEQDIPLSAQLALLLMARDGETMDSAIAMLQAEARRVPPEGA